MDSLAELALRHCSPLRGAEYRLGVDVVHDHLQLLPDWKLLEDGRAISKTFKFDDYYRTLAFVNAAAFIAHRQDHHPDLGVHYDRVVVRFSTHDVGGLSINDFISAAKLERLSD